MPKSTSLKIQSLFGSPLTMAFTLFLASFAALAAPLSLDNTPYYTPGGHLTVVVAYTPWCPPCKKTLLLLDELRQAHPSLRVHTLDVDSPAVLAQARSLGLENSVPMILVADKSGSVVKRFNALPNRTLFFDLIRRLEEGRLENGTLPIERRIDLWKNDRKGM